MVDTHTSKLYKIITQKSLTAKNTADLFKQTLKEGASLSHRHHTLIVEQSFE